MNHIISTLRPKHVNIICCKYFFIFLLFVLSQKSFAQAISGIGFGGGVNFPIHEALLPGLQGFLKTDIKLSNKLALVPAVGYIQLKEKQLKVSHNEGAELVFLSVSAKYYIKEHFFTQLGPIIALGGRNLKNINKGAGGGTLAAGYEFDIGHGNMLEIALHTDLLNTIPILGLNAAFKFPW